MPFYLIILYERTRVCAPEGRIGLRSSLEKRGDRGISKMKNKTLLYLLLVGLLIPAIAGAAALEELAKRLDSADSAERLEALRMIAVGYPAEGLPYLIRAAGDDDEYVRERAVQGLGISGSPRAVDPVRSALNDRDAFVRWRAVQAVGRLGDTGAVEALAGCAGDECWRVRVGTFEVLGSIGGDRAGSVLVRGLDDPDERVRLAAAAALARKQDGSSLPVLLDLLKNGSMFVRDEAAMALGNLGDTAAVEPLIEAVADPRNAIELDGRDWARWGAVKSLVKLTGQNFGMDAEKWDQWWKANKPE